MNKINKIKLGNTVYDILAPATSTEYGLIKIGYSLDSNNHKYPVQLEDGKAFVQVPWIEHTLAELMGSSAKGSGTQPIYWDGSFFVSTTCTLETSVPSNAVFTDTTYDTANANTAGLIKAVPHTGTVSCNNPSTVSDKYYSVEIDSQGKAFVNVPWVASQSENGAITEIQMNGSLVTNTNGVVNLGTVVTEDSIALYEVIRDPLNSTAYRLTNNKTFNDIHTDYINGKKQINIKYSDDQNCTRIYTLSYIDGSSALFLNFDSSDPVDGLIFYYIALPSSSNGYVSLGSNSVENGTDGSDGEDGVGIDTISITYATSSNGTTAPLSWNIAIPTVTPGDYLWTKILITCTDGTTTTAYSVARQGVNGTNGSSGGGASAMTISTSLGTSNTAEPNILYNLGTLNNSLTITLADTDSTLSSSTVGEYLFRFKTGSSSTVTFTTSLGVSILYPFDYVLNANTEYEVSVLWDGTSLLVRNCAYQSNT